MFTEASQSGGFGEGEGAQSFPGKHRPVKVDSGACGWCCSEQGPWKGSKGPRVARHPSNSVFPVNQEFPERVKTFLSLFFFLILFAFLEDDVGLLLFLEDSCLQPYTLHPVT